MTGRARFHEHACYTNSFPRLGPYSVEHHHVSSSRWADDVNNNYANGGHGPESFHLRNRNGYHQIDDSFTATGSRNKETAVKRAHSCIDATHDRDSMYPNAMSPLEDFPESGSSEPLAVCYDQIISLEPYSFSSSSSSRSVSSSCSSSSSFSSSSSVSSSCDSPSTTSSSSHSTSAPVPTCLSTLPALTCVQQSAVTTTPVTAFQETMAPSSASLAINFFMRAPSPSSLPRDSLPPERPQNDIIPTSTALTCEKDTDKDHPPPCCESVPEHAESQREIDSSSCTPCSDIDSISALCLTPTDTECRTMIRTQPVSANGASEAGSTSPDVSSTQLLTSDVANPQMAFGRAEEWKTVDSEAEERRSIEAVSRTPGEGKTAKVSHNDTGTASSTEFARPGGIVFSEGIAKSSGAIQVGSNLLETCAAVPKVNWGSDRKMSMDERVISGLRSHLDTYAGDKDDENNNNTSASRRSILPCRRNTSVAERSIWRKRCESETDADSKEDSTSAMSRLHQPDRRRASMGEHFIRRMRKELDVLEAEKDNDDDNFSTMTEVEDELNTSAFWRRAHARRKSRATMLYMMTIPDPNNQKLNWTKPPLTVLIIRKHMDESVLPPFIELVVWLVEKRNMLVYVENSVMEEPKMAEPEFLRVKDRLRPFTEGKDDLTDKVDFIICLGGDGTLLYASSLFQSSVPPVMAFNMGSLGFLTPFEFYKDFRHEVDKVLKGTASLLLRYRLKCVVIPYTISDGCIPHVKNIGREYISAKTHKLVLNEIVVDRGPSSYLCNLDLYIENRMVTSVQGDGLIISTPTGSTAYAVAAGASMIHPSVPCILITPICPHSLSFRPIVVPAGVEIKVMLCPNARGTAMVSFDGRDRQELHQGDSLRITTALYPVPSICATDQIEDWFDGLAECLHWNVRRPQLPLHPTSSLTSIESFESDAMTNSQHSVNGFSMDKNSHSTNFAPTAPDDTDQLHGT